MKTRWYIILLAATLIYPSATVMAADYSATITSLSEQLIVTGPAPLPNKFVDVSFDLLNNTGQTWTDFHMDQRTGFEGFFTPPASNYDGPGTPTLSNEIFGGVDFGPNTALDVVGLSILNGAHYNFMVDLTYDLEAGWALSGHPSVAGTSTPEPATMLLLGFGLAGVAWFRRKFSN